MSSGNTQQAVDKSDWLLDTAGQAQLPAAFRTGRTATQPLPSLAARAFRAKLGAAWWVLVLGGSALAQSDRFNVDRPVGMRETAARDLSVTPDGNGLPEGRGTVLDGEEVHRLRCAKCHGERGEGSEVEPIAGGFGTLRSPSPLKTVGSYWPYATTIWDVNRAIPFDRPGTLTPDQVYEVVAYLLYMNGIVEEADELISRNLADVRMPNGDSVVPALSVDSSVEAFPYRAMASGRPASPGPPCCGGALLRAG